MGEGRRTEIPVSDVSWSAAEIHLPQLLNEEAIADEFSNWEQVSSVATERFAHRDLRPPALSHPLPGFHYSAGVFLFVVCRYTGHNKH